MTSAKPRLPLIMLDEGLRLLFPAAAIHGMLWPLVWTLLYGLDLPLAHAIPVSQWHAHEMIFGTYGMALAGFLTTAVPEWTDTPRRRGRHLLLLLGLWLPGRIVGLFGADRLAGLSGLTDAAFLLLLTWFISKPLLDRRSTKHLSFPVWCGLFAGLEIATRLAWVVGVHELSGRLLEAGPGGFSGVLLALGGPHQCRGDQSGARSERWDNALPAPSRPAKPRRWPCRALCRCPLGIAQFSGPGLSGARGRRGLF